MERPLPNAPQFVSPANELDITISPQILAVTQSLIADVLGEDVDKVTPTATFFQDLEGESLDLLDLSFRCEKQFGVRVKFESVMKIEDIQTDSQGNITENSRLRLCQQNPGLDFSRLGPHTRLEHIRDAITVRSIAYLIQQAKEGKT